VARAAKV